MSRVNMSLDEIIAADKKGNRSGQDAFRKRTRGERGGKPRVMAGTERGFHTSNVPGGRWKHDLFSADVAMSKTGGNPRVRVLLSNLAPTVSTADVEELADPYNAESVNVHYNEAGESVGTGHVTLRRKDAVQMMNDLRGICIDEHMVKMTLVDETLPSTVGTVRDRVKFAKLSGGHSPSMRGTFRGGIFKKGSSGARSNWDQHDDRVPRGNSKEEPVERGVRIPRERISKLSEAELDAQLDAYMAKREADRDAVAME